MRYNLLDGECLVNFDSQAPKLAVYPAPLPQQDMLLGMPLRDSTNVLTDLSNLAVPSFIWNCEIPVHPEEIAGE